MEHVSITDILEVLFVICLFLSLAGGAIWAERQRMKREQRVRYIWRRMSHLSHLTKEATEHDPIRTRPIEWLTREVKRYAKKLKGL